MTTLPIRRVVLYKHGVGYFEREAVVEGDRSLALTFKQREVSDVLKSLTVLDLDGGLVSAVSYDSTTPVEKLLAEIALSIPDSGSLTALLPQLKGARVAVAPVASAERTAGMLLGIDTVNTRTPAGATQQVRVSVLTDAGDVRTFDLFDLNLQLLDDALRKDLDFYLRTQLCSKKKDARTFTLFAQGQGNRTVRVSYVLEAPVWKATYRILLEEPNPPAPFPGREGGESSSSPPRPGEGPGEGLSSQPLIQGWAVVDNTSDEDWEDVSLSLVAGLPVSFVHDLYTPRYIRRPVVQVQETTGVLPPMVEAGVEVSALAYGAASREAVPAPPPEGARLMARARQVSAPGILSGEAESAVSSVATQTRERQVGDLFEYAIETPVTVRRNQSALVPIVLKPFAGRSVLLYQKHARAENPIRCVEFENTTGLTLEGGPVTVLEQGNYVGEAMLDTLKPAEKRLVGYAVELAVRVTDSLDTHRDRVSRVVIRRGTLVASSASVVRTTYTFASKSDREQVLYLDHPRLASDWELADTPAPHEVTEHYWRFRLALPPNRVTSFAISQRRTDATEYRLFDMKEDQLAGWVSGRYLDARTEAALREALDLKARASAAEQKSQQHEQEQARIHKEQARVRENLTALGDRTTEKELRERLVRTLSQQEDRLEVLDREFHALRAERDALRERLYELVGKLEYERAVPG